MGYLNDLESESVKTKEESMLSVPHDILQREHDLFIQQTKLKNTLRHLMGAEQITHLCLEYYAL